MGISQLSRTSKKLMTKSGKTGQVVQVGPYVTLGLIFGSDVLALTLGNNV